MSNKLKNDAIVLAAKEKESSWLLKLYPLICLTFNLVAELILFLI